MFDELAKDAMQMHPSWGKKKLSVIKQLRNCENSRLSGFINNAKEKHPPHLQDAVTDITSPLYIQLQQFFVESLKFIVCLFNMVWS